MKSDDDMFINVPNLIHILLGGTVPVYVSTISLYDNLSVDVTSDRNRLKESNDLLLGFMQCSVRPVADVKSKWYSPSYMFAGEYYPDYLSGSSYVMSYNSVQSLYKESLRTPLYHLEDVYLTGIVAKRIKLKRQHHPLFQYYPNSDFCSWRGKISQHYVTPASVKMGYSFVINPNNSCQIPENNCNHVKFNLAYLRRSLNCITT